MRIELSQSKTKHGLLFAVGLLVFNAGCTLDNFWASQSTQIGDAIVAGSAIAAWNSFIASMGL